MTRLAIAALTLLALTQCGRPEPPPQQPLAATACSPETHAYLGQDGPVSCPPPTAEDYQEKRNVIATRDHECR